MSQTTITVTENLKAFYELIEVSIDTPLIALTEIGVALALVIYARLQWRTGQENIRQQLFAKRLEVFDFTNRVQKTANNGPKRYQDLEAINLLHEYKIKAGFLFGPEVNNWFTKLYDAVYEEFWLLEDERSIPDSEWREFVAKKTAARKRRQAIFDNRDQIFRPYLDFSNSRK